MKSITVLILCVSFSSCISKPAINEQTETEVTVNCNTSDTTQKYSGEMLKTNPNYSNAAVFWTNLRNKKAESVLEYLFDNLESEPLSEKIR